MQINFLDETIKALSDNNRLQSEVVWCGSKKFGYFTWDEFVQIANFNYDNGYGGTEIPMDLLIAGKDFWLERYEYDGSEWWEFKAKPELPKKYTKPSRLARDNEWGERYLQTT